MQSTKGNIAIVSGTSFGLCMLGMTSVWAASVASGCAAPTVKTDHNTYYVDPVHGSMSGDGSKAHPWHTLKEVLDVRNKLVANAPATWIAGMGVVKPGPNAPIKSGDTVYLMSGNHGSAIIQGYFGSGQTLYGYNNTDFITIAAAPGQKPIIPQLILKGANKWAFQGITFESLQEVPSNRGQPYGNKYPGTNDYFLVGMAGPNSNILFSSNTFQSQADTSAWTAYDWLSKRVSGIAAGATNCLSITNNKIVNIGFAIGFQRGSNVLVQHNVIDHFTDDGIDYGSNNTVIDGNQITNSIDDGDGFHQDAMQGQPYGNDPVSNIQITNNYVANQIEKLVSPANLQGIDTFDGVWNNIVVENNIVITNAYHGITFYGVNGISVINNTVIGVSTELGKGISTWININPSKAGAASKNAVVRNNTAAFFGINAAPALFDHNMQVTMNTNAVKYFKVTPNIDAIALATNVYKTFNSSTFQYDPRLLSSKAVAGGTRALAPATDIRGLSRGNSNTVDLGAMNYGGLAIALQTQINSIVTAKN